jgi:polyribonucleotide nucleotidyltransferase
MVVAGRVVGDDVAIMMVEAEATEATWDLVKNEGKTGPDRGGRRRGPRGRQEVHPVLCEAQSDLAAQAGQGDQEFPVFLDYQPTCMPRSRAPLPTWPQALLTIAGKQEREDALDAIKSRSHGKFVADGETVGERVRRSREGVSAAFRAVQKKLVRQRILRDKVRIDGRGLPTSGPCPPRSRCSRGCTVRRCSSAARPRSWVSPR